MGLALGIVALVVAIVSIFVPVLGAYLTLVASLSAIFATGKGLAFGIAALAINMINVVFLSPSLLVTAGLMEGVGFATINALAFIILLLLHFFFKKRNLKTDG